jgi:hypothetical protein
MRWKHHTNKRIAALNETGNISGREYNSIESQSCVNYKISVEAASMLPFIDDRRNSALVDESDPINMN